MLVLVPGERGAPYPGATFRGGTIYDGAADSIRGRAAMKVFLSWSGPRSREAALLFRDWLPKVIQAVDPWMSDVDIEKGAQWFAEISREVSASSFGIVFLTRENLEKPWLHFEAGALAKSLAADGSSPRVAAYLLGIEPTDVLGPLKEFQHTKATDEDTLKLLGSVNAAVVAKGERGLKDEMLKAVFGAFWPSLSDPLKSVIARDKKDRPRRDVRDMVEEILEYVRPRARQRDEAAIRAAAFEEQFLNAQQTHRVLQDRVLRAEERYVAADAARARLVADLAANSKDTTSARADLARIDADRAKLAVEVDRARSEFVMNEARLMTLREELAEAKRAAAAQ